MKTYLVSSKSENEFIENLKNVDESQYSIAILFISVSFNINRIVKEILNNGIDVFGSTTCGLFNYNLNDKYNLYDESIMALFLDIPKDSYLLGLEQITDEDKTAKDVSEYINEKKDFTNIFTFLSGMKKNNELVIEKLKENLDSNDTIYGGLAGDDSKFVEQFVFANGKISSEGIAFLAIDSKKYAMEGIATSGWQSIGSTKVITKAENNKIYEIDNEPALDYFINSLGINEDDLPMMGVEYPLMVEKNGRHILRAVFGVDKEERSIICAGTVPKGSKIKFSSSPGFEIIDNTLDEIKDFTNVIEKPDVAFAFSCMARHRALGPMISDELEGISKLLDSPIFGFFTYGEIGNSKFYPCEFHNETITLATLKEI